LKYIIFIALLIIPFKASYADECIPTPHRTTGTHYEPVTTQKNNISKGIVARGKVLAMPNCKPVSSAKVVHWQAGENGRYSDRLRAYLFTDSNGQYTFETEWPNLSPPHIHYIVTAEGYEILETQWVGSNRQNEIEFTMVLEKISD
jgi:protocatechuate 3,4-dioxygenase beta subunit